jgi:hypothetical protein
MADYPLVYAPKPLSDSTPEAALADYHVKVSVAPPLTTAVALLRHSSSSAIAQL